MAQTARVRIFVDFWNFQLGWNELHKATGLIQIPWKDLHTSMLP